MNNRNSRDLRTTSSAKGFVLLEALIAILVFSIGILALTGFHAFSIKQSGDAKQRVNASFIANEIESALFSMASTSVADCAGTYTTESTSKCSIDWSKRLNALPNGKVVVAIANTDQLTVTVTWQQPGEEEHRYVHQAELLRN